MAKRIPCHACAKVYGPAKARCHKCRGVGYTELTECPAKGIAFLDECAAFLSSDPMTGGWECSRCHESGPMPRSTKP